MGIESSTVWRGDGERATRRVDVCRSEDGGWNVTAIVGGRVLTTQHSHDWHKVECLRVWLDLEWFKPIVSEPGASDTARREAL